MLGEALRRAWALGAGPGSEQLVIDLDSTICEVCGKAKHGAGYGYTKVLGYHPILATRAWTGEVLHVRMRKGAASTQRGAVRFVEELVARVRRARATGELIMRFDSGFWSNATLATLERLDVGYTMGVRMIKAVTRAVEGIDGSAWTPIDYTVDGEAEVAECDYKGRRLIVRRTRLVGRQATLWPQWRHFAFVTDLGGKAVDVDEFREVPKRPSEPTKLVRVAAVTIPGMTQAMAAPDDRSERQRLVDHLQDRHGPGLRIGDAATLELLSELHDQRHNAQDGAGHWPGGSEGPHKMPDRTSWDDTKRLRTHLSRTHEIETVTYPESLAKLRDLHDQLHDDAYSHRSPNEWHGERDHDRSDLT